jgi:hypothetical protein
MIKKHLDLIIVTFVVLSIILYDVTLEILGECFHLLLELLHTIFEWVELGVEHVVEYVFHILHMGETVEYLFITERHGSQVVTFYILMGMIAYLLYRLSKYLPSSYEASKRFMLMAWVRRKTQLQLYWHSLSQLHKVAVVFTALSVAYLASFFVI